MPPLYTLRLRRFVPALIAAVAFAAWWSLTVFAPIATADPAGVMHALSRLALHADLFLPAARS
jgi:hypothetical protein